MSAVAKPVEADKPMIMAQAINLAIDDAMAVDPRVIMFGEDVGDPEGGGVAGVSRGLSTKYGWERVRSTPIAEQAIIGAAIGAAMGGMRPIAEIMMMNFTTVAMDMIINHAAKLRFMTGGQTSVPIVIHMMTGAGSGNGGQHSDMLEAWFCHTPGLKVVVPSSAADAYGLMLGALADPDPVIFIENLTLLRRGKPAVITQRNKAIPLGKANVARQGKDVTVISYGRQFIESMEAAEELAKQGIECEVVDLRTVSPLDMATCIASASKTGRVVIAHEAVKSFGPGAEIAAQLNETLFGKLKAPIQRLGAPFCAVPFSKALETPFTILRPEIAAGIKKAMGEMRQ
jgi:pyruvate/2-oxoglutarate/acetoin dehydrogenase E1 component